MAAARKQNRATLEANGQTYLVSWGQNDSYEQHRQWQDSHHEHYVIVFFFWKNFIQKLNLEQSLLARYLIHSKMGEEKKIKVEFKFKLV